MFNPFEFQLAMFNAWLSMFAPAKPRQRMIVEWEDNVAYPRNIRWERD